MASSKDREKQKKKSRSSKKQDHPDYRQLRAEDPNWAVCPVPYLSDLCLNYISEHFIELGIMNVKKYTDSSQWEKLMNMLSLDLPEEILLPRLEDDVYWKRRGMKEKRWKIMDTTNGKWRKLYAERRVAEVVEEFVPNRTDPEVLRKIVRITKGLVTCLHIRQLRMVANKEPDISDEDESDGEETEDLQAPERYTHPDHMNVGSVLIQFPNLDEFSLTMAAKDYGMEYEYEKSVLTYNDGENLTKCLKQLPKLKVLRLRGCYISFLLCKAISYTFKDHPNLKELDLSYNLLKPLSGKYIGLVLMGSCPLETLKLTYNRLENEGVMFLASLFTEPTVVLLKLDLRLNNIGDQGAEFLAKCLNKNSTLKYLDVSGNAFRTKGAVAFAELIKRSQSLVVVNLSCNNLGPQGGKALKDAISLNIKILELDVRLCNIDEADHIGIKDYISRNFHETMTIR